MPCGLEYICISLILGNVISEILSFTYIFYLFKLDEKKLPKTKNDNSFFERRIMKITIPVGLTSFIRSGLSTIKQILTPLGFERNGNSCEQALSNYGLISGMAMPLILFPNIVILAFSNLLIPEFAELNYRAQNTKIRSTTKLIILFSIVFSIIVSVLIFFFAGQLSNIIYKSTNVIIYIKLLAPIIPVMYLDSVVDAILKGLDQQVAVLKINIIDLITSIILTLTIIPLFGINGYIFIIYFSEFLNFAFSFSCLIKTIK